MSEARGGEGPPPPSPLTGGYLLIVLPQLHSPLHKDRLIHALTKGLITWDAEECHVDLNKELSNITSQAPEGEEAKNGERLIQFASENLVTEVLIHPQLNTLVQCIRNCLSSFTRHRHIVHAGYTSTGNGAWVLQDGTYSFSDFADMYSEHEVQRVLRAYEGTVSVDVHCSNEGDWWALRAKDPFSKVSRVRLNPPDKMSTTDAVREFLSYLGQYLVPAGLTEILESSDVVGNIRFSHPTLYVFPGGQGDAALFGINGFNMLVDGGFSRKSCFWDFTRHLDRLDSVLMTRINNGNLQGLASLLRRKQGDQVYPQIGHFFSNIPDRKQVLSPDGDKDRDPLLINLIEQGQEMLAGMKHIGLRPQSCYRDPAVEPINLYHKVGHGKLDMYVLSPAKESREVREFLAKWAAVDSKIFCSYSRKGEFNFPLSSKTSICALLVWQPANPEDNITRLLFPGSTPQQKIFEGLDKLKNLEFMKHPVCSAKSLSPSSSTMKLSIKAAPPKAPLIEKVAENEKKQAETVKAVKQVPEVKKIPPKPKAKADRPKEKPEKPKTDLETKQETVKIDKKPSEAVQTKKEKEVEKETKEVKKEKPKRPVQKPPERKPQKSTEKKDSVKSSPTTPKKTVENKLSEMAKTESKPEVKTRASKVKASPPATPAKSAKEANNRKVLELKSKETSRLQAQKAQPPKKDEQKKVEKAVGKKPSPTPKSTKPSSPVKSAKAGTKQKLDVKKGGKSDKDIPTDSSAVSTPSTVDAELIKAKEEAEKLKEIDDSKQDDTSKHEEPEISRKESEDKGKSTSKDEDEEILIVEKVEISNEITGKSDVETIAVHLQKVDEAKKKKQKTELKEDLEAGKEKVAADLPIETKQVAQEEVQEIIETATEIVSKKLDMQKTESQEISGKDLGSTDKIITPKEKEVKSGDIEQKIDESQPDEKFSTTIESGATTTAPTLPEDERIPLDEIKEGIEEKHVKEETKEKEIAPAPRPEQPTSLPQVPVIAGTIFDQRAQRLKDIVKTPDEVADLPVHEEADIGIYEGERPDELLSLPPGKRDRKEETTEELKLFKDNLEKEDKSKDLKEDMVESVDMLSHTTTDLDLISSSPKSGKPHESDEKEEDLQEGVKADIEHTKEVKEDIKDDLAVKTETEEPKQEELIQEEKQEIQSGDAPIEEKFTLTGKEKTDIKLTTEEQKDDLIEGDKQNIITDKEGLELSTEIKVSQDQNALNLDEKSTQEKQDIEESKEAGKEKLDGSETTLQLDLKDKEETGESMKLEEIKEKDDKKDVKEPKSLSPKDSITDLAKVDKQGKEVLGSDLIDTKHEDAQIVDTTDLATIDDKKATPPGEKIETTHGAKDEPIEDSVKTTEVKDVEISKDADHDLIKQIKIDGKKSPEEGLLDDQVLPTEIEGGEKTPSPKDKSHEISPEHFLEKSQEKVDKTEKAESPRASPEKDMIETEKDKITSDLLGESKPEIGVIEDTKHKVDKDILKIDETTFSDERPAPPLHTTSDKDKADISKIDAAVLPIREDEAISKKESISPKTNDDFELKESHEPSYINGLATEDFAVNAFEKDISPKELESSALKDEKYILKQDEKEVPPPVSSTEEKKIGDEDMKDSLVEKDQTEKSEKSKGKEDKVEHDGDIKEKLLAETEESIKTEVQETVEEISIDKKTIDEQKAKEVKEDEKIVATVEKVETKIESSELVHEKPKQALTEEPVEMEVKEIRPNKTKDQTIDDTKKVIEEEDLEKTSDITLNGSSSKTVEESEATKEVKTALDSAKPAEDISELTSISKDVTVIESELELEDSKSPDHITESKALPSKELESTKFGSIHDQKEITTVDLDMKKTLDSVDGELQKEITAAKVEKTDSFVDKAIEKTDKVSEKETLVVEETEKATAIPIKPETTMEDTEIIKFDAKNEILPDQEITEAEPIKPIKDEKAAVTSITEKAKKEDLEDLPTSGAKKDEEKEKSELEIQQVKDEKTPIPSKAGEDKKEDLKATPMMEFKEETKALESVKDEKIPLSTAEDVKKEVLKATPTSQARKDEEKETSELVKDEKIPLSTAEDVKTEDLKLPLKSQAKKDEENETSELVKDEKISEPLTVGELKKEDLKETSISEAKKHEHKETLGPIEDEVITVPSITDEQKKDDTEGIPISQDKKDDETETSGLDKISMSSTTEGDKKDDKKEAPVEDQKISVPSTTEKVMKDDLKSITSLETKPDEEKETIKPGHVPEDKTPSTISQAEEARTQKEELSTEGIIKEIESAIEGTKDKLFDLLDEKATKISGIHTSKEEIICSKDSLKTLEEKSLDKEFKIKSEDIKDKDETLQDKEALEKASDKTAIEGEINMKGLKEVEEKPFILDRHGEVKKDEEEISTSSPDQKQESEKPGLLKESLDEASVKEKEVSKMDGAITQHADVKKEETKDEKITPAISEFEKSVLDLDGNQIIKSTDMSSSPQKDAASGDIMQVESSIEQKESLTTQKKDEDVEIVKKDEIRPSEVKGKIHDKLPEDKELEEQIDMSKQDLADSGLIKDKPMGASDKDIGLSTSLDSTKPQYETKLDAGVKDLEPVITETKQSDTTEKTTSELSKFVDVGKDSSESEQAHKIEKTEETSLKITNGEKKEIDNQEKLIEPKSPGQKDSSEHGILDEHKLSGKLIESQDSVQPASEDLSSQINLIQEKESAGTDLKISHLTQTTAQIVPVLPEESEKDTMNADLDNKQPDKKQIEISKTIPNELKEKSEEVKQVFSVEESLGSELGKDDLCELASTYTNGNEVEKVYDKSSSQLPSDSFSSTTYVTKYTTYTTIGKQEEVSKQAFDDSSSGIKTETKQETGKDGSITVTKTVTTKEIITETKPASDKTNGFQKTEEQIDKTESKEEKSKLDLHLDQEITASQISSVLDSSLEKKTDLDATSLEKASEAIKEFGLDIKPEQKGIADSIITEHPTVEEIILTGTSVVETGTVASRLLDTTCKDEAIFLEDSKDFKGSKIAEKLLTEVSEEDDCVTDTKAIEVKETKAQDKSELEIPSKDSKTLDMAIGDKKHSLDKEKSDIKDSEDKDLKPIPGDKKASEAVEKEELEKDAKVKEDFGLILDDKAKLESSLETKISLGDTSLQSKMKPDEAHTELLDMKGISEDIKELKPINETDLETKGMLDSMLITTLEGKKELIEPEERKGSELECTAELKLTKEEDKLKGTSEELKDLDNQIQDNLLNKQAEKDVTVALEVKEDSQIKLDEAQVPKDEIKSSMSEVQKPKDLASFSEDIISEESLVQKTENDTKAPAVASTKELEKPEDKEVIKTAEVEEGSEVTVGDKKIEVMKESDFIKELGVQKSTTDLEGTMSTTGLVVAKSTSEIKDDIEKSDKDKELKVDEKVESTTITCKGAIEPVSGGEVGEKDLGSVITKPSEGKVDLKEEYDFMKDIKESIKTDLELDSKEKMQTEAKHEPSFIPPSEKTDISPKPLDKKDVSEDKPKSDSKLLDSDLKSQTESKGDLTTSTYEKSDSKTDSLDTKAVETSESKSGIEAVKKDPVDSKPSLGAAEDSSVKIEDTKNLDASSETSKDKIDEKQSTETTIPEKCQFPGKEVIHSSEIDNLGATDTNISDEKLVQKDNELDEGKVDKLVKHDIKKDLETTQFYIEKHLEPTVLDKKVDIDSVSSSVIVDKKYEIPEESTTKDDLEEYKVCDEKELSSSVCELKKLKDGGESLQKELDETNKLHNLAGREIESDLNISEKYSSEIIQEHLQNGDSKKVDEKTSLTEIKQEESTKQESFGKDVFSDSKVKEEGTSKTVTEKKLDGDTSQSILETSKALETKTTTSTTESSLSKSFPHLDEKEPLTFSEDTRMTEIKESSKTSDQTTEKESSKKTVDPEVAKIEKGSLDSSIKEEKVDKGHATVIDLSTSESSIEKEVLTFSTSSTGSVQPAGAKQLNGSPEKASLAKINGFSEKNVEDSVIKEDICVISSINTFSETSSSHLTETAAQIVPVLPEKCEKDTMNADLKNKQTDEKQIEISKTIPHELKEKSEDVKQVFSGEESLGKDGLCELASPYSNGNKVEKAYEKSSQLPSDSYSSTTYVTKYTTYSTNGKQEEVSKQAFDESSSGIKTETKQETGKDGSVTVTKTVTTKELITETTPVPDKTNGFQKTEHKIDKTESNDLTEAIKLDSGGTESTTGQSKDGAIGKMEFEPICKVEKIITEKHEIESVKDVSVVKSKLISEVSHPLNGSSTHKESEQKEKLSNGDKLSSGVMSESVSGVDISKSGKTQESKVLAEHEKETQSKHQEPHTKETSVVKEVASRSSFETSSSPKKDQIKHEPLAQSSAITDLSMIKDMTASFISTEKWIGRPIDTPEGRLSPSSEASAAWRESDDDLPASPLSTTSHVHSPPPAMFSSIYGQRFEDDDSDTDFETAVREHTELRGQPIETMRSTIGHPLDSITDMTQSFISREPLPLESTKLPLAGTHLDKKHTSTESRLESSSSPQPSSSTKDPIGKWDKPLGLPPPPNGKNYWSPFKEWGRPLHLPSPAPPPNETENDDTSGSAKTTPKKVARMNEENNRYASNIVIGKEANNKNRRSDSPVKKASRDGKRSGMSHIYVDLSYVPHHGNSHYANVEFFKRIRARYYVFSGTEPSKDVFNALLEAKQTWEDKDLEVTIIPTYDTDTLGYWIAENEETLSKYKIDLSPSASRCTINLQDHDTSCSAYRLEF